MHDLALQIGDIDHLQKPCVGGMNEEAKKSNSQMDWDDDAEA
jgi:hypothetical protein